MIQCDLGGSFILNTSAVAMLFSARVHTVMGFHKEPTVCYGSPALILDWGPEAGTVPRQMPSAGTERVSPVARSLPIRSGQAGPVPAREVAPRRRPLCDGPKSPCDSLGPMRFFRPYYSGRKLEHTSATNNSISSAFW